MPKSNLSSEPLSVHYIGRTDDRIDGSETSSFYFVARVKYGDN